MNANDEARLDWSEDGPDEGDVLADNERLAAENETLRARVAELEAIERRAAAIRDRWADDPDQTLARAMAHVLGQVAS